MIVRRHASAAEYLDAVGPSLRRAPVINQLVIGIAQQVLREPDRYAAGTFFFSVDDGGEVVGAALQTVPWPVQLSNTSRDVARVLARAFAELPDALAGVAGPDDAPGAFAAEYVAHRALRSTLAQAMGAFELRAVEPVPAPPGQRVTAGPAHADVVQGWLAAFRAEASHADPPPRADAGQRAVSTGRAHVWLDAGGTPVSYAFNNRDIEGWASIGPVYTPPAERGRGYATALVASVSQFLLDQGRPGCMLYTDLANPTSNAIYERIGYRRVGSSFRYELG